MARDYWKVVAGHPALFGTHEVPSPLLSHMLRTPHAAQTLAVMGVSRRWQLARNANVVAECGAGKTLIALGSMLVHSAGRPFTGLVVAPPVVANLHKTGASLGQASDGVYYCDALSARSPLFSGTALKSHHAATR